MDGASKQVADLIGRQSARTGLLAGVSIDAPLNAMVGVAARGDADWQASPMTNRNQTPR